MNRVSVYQIPVAHDVLRSAAAATSVPAPLVEPLQAMVAALAHRAAEAPVRVYLCAEDDDNAARDGFAYALARSLAAHVPSTLVVDCDFLHVGLSGLIPQPDALGLLDFLLYGSSMGVVAQEAPHGVRVVGAGSFPVTKRMPFVKSAFEDAARRLAAHARCAIFVGPLRDEEGGAHPLAGAVDVVAVLRADERPRRGADVGGLEESIAGGGVEVWSVRTSPAAPEAPARPAAAPPRARETARPQAKGPATRPQPPAPPKPEAPAPEPRYSALVPRIAVAVFALLVIGFVAWWVWQERRSGGAAQEPAPTPTVAATTTAVDTIAARPDTVAAADADTTSAPPPQSAPPPAPVRPADTGGRSGGTVLIDPANILVMDDLERRWKGWYAVHISSFQESIRAREEVSFFTSREFPVFIVFLDLDAKGKWYRVYAGPFATREEAREVKKNLDAIPQVRFTRVTQLPE